MVKKHKKRTEHTKKKKIEKTVDYKWVIAGVILLGIVFYNISGKNSLFKPRVTPTPTIAVKILSPADLNADQAVYVKLAKDDLSKKLSINADDIKILGVTDKKWNDTSLGCPEKNKLYLQVVTPGYEMTLSAKSQKYIYNGGLNRVVSCE